MKTNLFIVTGAKWFDRVNGNTYNNAKVIDVDNSTIFYIGFEYGYGSDYFNRAVKKARERNPEAVFIDNGAFYVTKKVAKNDLF